LRFLIILNYWVFFETLDLNFLRSMDTFKFVCRKRRIVVSDNILLRLNKFSLLINFNVCDVIIYFIFLFFNQRILSAYSWINLIWVTRPPIRYILNFFKSFIQITFFRNTLAVSFPLNVLLNSVLPYIDCSDVSRSFIFMFLDIEKVVFAL